MEVLLLFWAVFFFEKAFFSTPIHKVGVPLHAFMNCSFAYRIRSVAVVEAIGGAIEMAYLLIFPEKDLELLGLLHLYGV